MNFIERAVRVMEDAHEAARQSEAQAAEKDSRSETAPKSESTGASGLEVVDTGPVDTVPAAATTVAAAPVASTVPVSEPASEINAAPVDGGVDEDLDDEAIDRDNVDTYTGAVLRNSTDRIRAAHVRALRAKIDEVEASVEEATVTMPPAPAGSTTPAAPASEPAGSGTTTSVPAAAGGSPVSGEVPPGSEPSTNSKPSTSTSGDPSTSGTIPVVDHPVVLAPTPDTEKPAEPVELASYRQANGKLNLKAVRAQAYLDPDGREDALREAFEPMADELLEQMAGDASADTPMGRRILVTSAEAGAGRSLCGIHLALSLVVDHGQTVTYVDLDFNGTPVLPALGVKPGPGVADWLDGQSKTVDTLVIPTELNGLKLIAGGTPAAVSLSGLELDRQAINAFLLALGSRFPDDLIVLGAPAIMTSANATILAGLAAQVVVVVAAGQTQRETLAQSLEALQRHSRVSLLLNKMKV